jgi:hypothetical protein
VARPELQKLYQQLTATAFGFVARGERSVQEIYGAVKTQFPSLCDDSLLCRENCAHGNNQPEWQHCVRRALQRLKFTTGPLRHGNRPAHWVFD